MINPVLHYKEVPPPVKSKKKIPLEKVVESDFHKAVCRAGGMTYKFMSPNTRSVSDRIVVFFGRIIFVEMKRQGKDLSEKQAKFRKDIVGHGAEYAMIAGHSGIKPFMDKLISEAPWYAKFIALFKVSVTAFNNKYK